MTVEKMAELAMYQMLVLMQADAESARHEARRRKRLPGDCQAARCGGGEVKMRYSFDADGCLELRRMKSEGTQAR